MTSKGGCKHREICQAAMTSKHVKVGLHRTAQKRPKPHCHREIASETLFCKVPGSPPSLSQHLLHNARAQMRPRWLIACRYHTQSALSWMTVKTIGCCKVQVVLHHQPYASIIWRMLQLKNDKQKYPEIALKLVMSWVGCVCVCVFSAWIVLQSHEESVTWKVLLQQLQTKYFDQRNRRLIIGT